MSRTAASNQRHRPRAGWLSARETSMTTFSPSRLAILQPGELTTFGGMPRLPDKWLLQCSMLGEPRSPYSSWWRRSERMAWMIKAS